MEKTVYSLEITPKRGKVYSYYNFDTLAKAEKAARENRNYGCYKSVKVISKTYTPSAQSANACMLTIAR
jgi:hypothetical protein